MHLIDAAGHVNNQFVHEDPATNRPPTEIDAAWLNAIQNEIANVITASGVPLNKSENDQLFAAISRIFASSVSAFRQPFLRIIGTHALPATAFGIYVLEGGGAASTVTLPSTVDLIDSTELLLFSDSTNTLAVQIKAAAGQSIQGSAALMAGSTTALMLPTAGDWVRLRSEKSQGRWVVVACYAAGERNRVAALEAVPKPLGVGQTWQDMSVSRAFNVTYTNTTGRPIWVQVSQNNSSTYFNCLVGGVVIFSVREDSTSDMPLGFLVPAGSTYRIDSTSGNLLSWLELR